MPAWIYWLIRFAVETFRAMWPALSWPGTLVKALVILGSLSAALMLTNRVSVVVATQDGMQMWESSHLELRWFVYGCFGLAPFIWALGAAWVRVFTLRVDECVRANKDFVYQLSIANLGFSDTPVQVRMEEVADESRSRDDLNTEFPITLFHAPISRGLPQNVTLFSGHMSSTESHPQTVFTVASVTEPERISFTSPHLHLTPKNKIWFRVSISQIDRSMWFSVQMVDANCQTPLAVARELPPHLPRRSWFARLFINS